MYFAAFVGLFGAFALPIWLMYLIVKWLISRGTR